MWTREDAEKFLFVIEPALRESKQTAQIIGSVAEVGYSDKDLDLKLEATEEIWEYTPEYLSRVPDGMDPDEFSMQGGYYNYARDTITNDTIFLDILDGWGVIKSRTAVDTDMYLGSMCTAELQNDKIVDFIWGWDSEPPGGSLRELISGAGESLMRVGVIDGLFAAIRFRDKIYVAPSEQYSHAYVIGMIVEDIAEEEGIETEAGWDRLFDELLMTTDYRLNGGFMYRGKWLDREDVGRLFGEWTAEELAEVELSER